MCSFIFHERERERETKVDIFTNERVIKNMKQMRHNNKKTRQKERENTWFIVL